MPDGFDDADEYQAFLQDFRSQLTGIMKHISRRMPDAALSACTQRLQAALTANTQAVPSEVCLSPP